VGPWAVKAPRLGGEKRREEKGYIYIYILVRVTYRTIIYIHDRPELTICLSSHIFMLVTVAWYCYLHEKRIKNSTEKSETEASLSTKY
jgi:hypothetical protein